MTSNGTEIKRFVIRWTQSDGQRFSVVCDRPTEAAAMLGMVKALYHVTLEGVDSNGKHHRIARHEPDSF